MPVGSSGGMKVFRRISTADTNSALVKAGSGIVYGLHVSNVNAAARYLKLYDKLTAPTVGTDTPVLTILVAGAATGGTTFVEFPGGVAFTAGLGIGVTGAVADADTTAAAAGEQVVHLFYR